MTQRQSRIMAGEMDADELGGRWRRRLVRTIALVIFLWLGIKALFAAPGSPWIWAFGIYILLWLLSPLMVWWAGRRRRTVWRRDGRMFEPSLPRPVSDIPEEQEWTLPFHPLIRVPLALLLMGLMYWVLVIHQMQLPGHWLVATTIVTIINLWSWREPLVLVALVAVGVLLMTIVGWIINHLPIEAAIAVLVLIPVVIVIAVHELRKRKLRSQA
ncbi:MAG: hypothetical protein RL001_1360 [Pseudomonadota bacterium]|jgi:hypothetical protein|nr:hypothetical protein [Oxalobacteraceae bacterium]